MEVRGVYSGTYTLLHSKWIHSLPWSRTTGDTGPLKRKLLGGTWQKSPRIYIFYNLRNKVIKVKSWLIASPRTDYDFTLSFPLFFLIPIDFDSLSSSDNVLPPEAPLVSLKPVQRYRIHLHSLWSLGNSFTFIL